MQNSRNGKKARFDKTGLILVIIFLVGLSLLLYPTVSDYWNSKAQSKAIVNYEEVISQLDRDECEKQFAEAQRYNERLSELSFPFNDYGSIDGYYNALNAAGSGIIGYINIEKINVELPVYHGTSSEVLNSAVGHLEGTDLPVGGIGNHTVLSAHRGLPGAKLFTNLDKMEIGDTFILTVLDRTMTYQVDKISIITPDSTEELYPIEDGDYCTLMTCTPYGINTHRLLVRGRRIENERKPSVIFITAEAYVINPMVVTPAVAVPMLIILLVYMLIMNKRRSRKKTGRRQAA